MRISKQEVLHVANLARLNIDESQIDRFADQIGQILEYVETLNELDTTGVVPTSHAIDMANAFRDDELSKPLDRKTVLANAPEDDEGSFIVPKVIE